MTKNQIDYWRLKEEERHNKDTEDMNRNLAVYQAYKMKNEGDLAMSKHHHEALKTVQSLLSPVTTALFS